MYLWYILNMDAVQHGSRNLPFLSRYLLDVYYTTNLKIILTKIREKDLVLILEFQRSYSHRMIFLNFSLHTSFCAGGPD